MLLLLIATEEAKASASQRDGEGSGEDLLTRSFGSSRVRVEGVLAIYN